MKEKLKKLIIEHEFDAALQLMKEQFGSDSTKFSLILNLEKSWEGFKRGLSMNYYAMNQIAGRVQSDFLNLVEELDIKPEKTTTSLDDNALNTEPTKDSKHKESGNDSPTLEYVGFWKRVLIRVIDSIIGLALFPINLALIKYSFNNKVILPLLITSFIYICIQMFLVVRFGGTIGKLILNVRIVDKAGRYLTLDKAFVRDSPYLFISLLSFLAYATTINALDENIHVASLREISLLLVIHASGVLNLSRFLNLFALFDVITVAFNDKKRAIHDFMAGSFVVTKDSINGSA